MRLNPYLMFNGQCREAFQFYEQCFGGTLGYMATYAESPETPPVVPELRNRIMHATLHFDGDSLMASDTPTDKPQPPSSTHLAIEAGSPEKAQTLFAALSEGATITMPMSETFWAYKFGMLTDRFGVPWMVSAGKPMSA